MQADWAQKGQGSPLLLHILQVDAIMVVVSATVGPAMLVVVMVLVLMDLVEGNRASRFAGLFALGGMNLAMSSLPILDFTFFCTLFLDLLEKGLLFVNGLGFGWNSLFSSFFPPHMLLFSFAKKEMISSITPGAAGCCFNSVIFYKCVYLLDCSYS